MAGVCGQQPQADDPTCCAQVLCLTVGAFVATASGLVVGAPVRATVRTTEPSMSESRRSVIAAALLFAPAAASAMIVPGLNAPGLVPATKKPAGPKPEWDSFRDVSHFWSSEGVSHFAQQRCAS